MDRIPASVTRRRWPIPGRGRAPGDQAVIRQTILLTKSNPNQQYSSVPSTAQDQHPFWTADERYIFFDSDRVSDTDTTERPDKVYNIFRMNANINPNG